MTEAAQVYNLPALRTQEFPSAPLTVALRPSTTALSRYSYDDIQRVAHAFAQSGLFKDGKNPASFASCVVKLMTAQELGISFFSSLSQIYLIEGRVTLGAHVLATLVKKSGRYNYRVLRKDNEGCVIRFFEDGDAIGDSAFDLEDAKRAGLYPQKDNWRLYPRAMCYSRAMSEGQRTYCPDVTSGPVYTPDEIDDAAVTYDAQGQVVSVRESLAPGTPAAAAPTETPAAPQPPKPPSMTALATLWEGYMLPLDRLRAFLEAAFPDVLNRADRRLTEEERIQAKSMIDEYGEAERVRREGGGAPSDQVAQTASVEEAPQAIEPQPAPAPPAPPPPPAPVRAVATKAEPMPVERCVACHEPIGDPHLEGCPEDSTSAVVAAENAAMAGQGQQTLLPPHDEPEVVDAEAEAARKRQISKIQILFGKLDIKTEAARHRWGSVIVGKPSTKTMTWDERSKLLDHLVSMCQKKGIAVDG